MKIQHIGHLILAAAMSALVGCGGGGGGAAPVVPPTQPTKAIVKLATSGTLPTGKVIGGIDATLTYATGKGLSIDGSNAVASGVGNGSLIQANTNTAGQVRAVLVNATGIQTSEFATMTFGIASGNSPVTGDFSIAAGASVIDTNGVTIPGITVTISSVEFQ